MGSVPDVRTERVDELKKRLKGGCLDMDSHSVAEKLLYETILDELL
jgi:anti-sigma28 factor (negative regulator of flagellin synthesis)